MTHNNTMAVSRRLPTRRVAATLPCLVLCLLACLVASVAQAQSKFSLEGQLNLGTDVMDIPFTLSTLVASPSTLEFRTWSHSGGANNAGDVIPAGGFDPTLALLDNTPTLIAFIDDGTGVSGNFDSLLSFASGPLPSPLTVGDYTLRLEALGDGFGSGTKNWAVDLTGPDDVLKLELDTIDLVPGSAGISKATVTGAGSQWNNSDPLYIGLSGNGTLNIEVGGVVANTAGYVGRNSGSTGVATVTGTGSQWNNSDGLYLGGDATNDGGVGTLNINSGGRVQVGDDTYTLVGGGNELIVSDAGMDGNLIVRHGSTITNSGAVIGAATGRTGTATVTGTGSQWNNSDFLFVGDSGNGTLNIEASGVVTNADGYIGFDSGSTGAATVTGPGSQWNNSSKLYVGYFGDGTLQVEAGGVVANTEGIIGFDSGSTSAATVTGPDSQWNNSSSLDVGYFGDGTLQVEAGGVVANTEGYLGRFSGSTGAATVTGTGSQWNNSAGLFLGGDATTDGGVGTLNINSGGRVQVGDDASTLGPTEMIISDAGTLGNLVVRHGSTITHSGLAAIGASAGHTGTATVTGTGSQWNNSDILYVGDEGAGTLNVEAGGVVANTIGIIGRQSSSTSEVTVTGGGSQWNNSDFLFVGDFGNGTLNIEAGGVVTNTDARIGAFAGSIGTATVTGAGSQWNNSLELSVGFSGDGTLQVEAGGVVANTDGYIGYDSGSTGAATVTGTGSQWNNSVDLYIGGSSFAAGGTGTLDILDSGLVSVGGTTKLWAGGTVTLDGGSLTTGSFDNSEAGTFNFHDGTLTVNGAGGTFNPGTADLRIEGNTPSASPLLVIANTATATFTGNTTVGFFGNGGMTVESGGVVSNANGMVGLISSVTAEATVTGAGSRWNNSGNLSVGQEGNGALSVEAGGVVTSTEGTIGYHASSTGEATVTDAGSQWNNSSHLRVGRGGDGTLNVEAEGVVTNTFGFIATQVGSVGNVTVTGAGSQWNNSADLYIGGSSFAAGGTATLDIGGYQDSALHDEGTVTVAGTTKLWAGGTLTIDGYESTLTTGSFDNSEGGTFHFDQGILNVNGAVGTFNPGTADFVLEAGESVIMTISNTATASLTGDLTVGNTEGGSASLYIESGSMVSNTDGYIGRALGVPSSLRTGLVSVTGAGSQWNNSNDLSVGGLLASNVFPTGELEILDDGLVSVLGTTTLHSGGAVTLDGGTLDTTTLDITEGTFDMFDGTLSTLSVLGDLDNQGGALVADSLVFITGDYTQANAASLHLTIPGPILGEFGSIDVSGQVNLDGTLNVSNGSSRIAGDFFTIVGGAINGVFDTVTISGTPLAAGLEWQVDYFANRVDLLVSLSGDFNGDGTVDAADYTVWRDGLGTIYSQADYTVWVNHFGATASSSTSSSSVPEPTTLLLTVLLLSVHVDRGRSLR